MATENKNLSNYDKTQLPNAEASRFGIVVSQWNSHITHNLQKGAIETLIDLGAKEENISSHEVPGSFELIYGANQLCKRGEVDAVIVIGSVIRGETSHFDYVCEGVTQGIKDLNIKYNIPVIFCVLTDDNEQQSLDRSGGKHGNKGVEAAVAAVIMTKF
ncbi:6,7-dimethyl-8-ribityllumazine synthase [Moheibacter sediminis]|uniref:6,7-dimethyl-8-ribityllumazine synthase n=1 Tax=Moheibacter sediminis TaxID=1434700 RepID=A0A1W1Y6F9_9FLAO|nr:6,7-dimethyl-8-ribityllumazine synthase [Moheibacter sediminis]SMC31746.1 6,7-dimethyl-8-ribityllumazine synthase [Moheibacter sediminis]